MRHIEVLASDAFQGRAPGTEGETLTTAYIVAALQRRSIEPGGTDGSWLQPVALVERRPLSHRTRWFAGGRAVPLGDSRIALAGSEPVQRLEHAPVVFVGHGVVDRERGIDQLAGADLRGAVALMLAEGPDIPDFPSLRSRVRAVAAAGASAVIRIVDDSISWEAVLAGAAASETMRDVGLPPVLGSMPATEADRLARAAGTDLASLLDEQPGPTFRAVPLALSVSIEVTTQIRRFASSNVVGRIRGSGGGRESVLLLGHWDHLGLCRPEASDDRICNGAVDNASGIAMLIEAAGRLAAGPQPTRDILLLATTAEEVGLLGAEHFAAEPTVPLESIVAAVNVDTVAIHGRGEPVAVIGRGVAPLDAAIAATATALGRTMDTSHAADAFVRRQDGWALAAAGVPAVMVGGSFANMNALNAFLAGDYHGPNDEARPDIPLDGAAEDANLLVELARRLADPAHYQPPLR